MRYSEMLSPLHYRAFYITNRFAKPNMNNDIIPFRFDTSAKTFTVDVIADFHRTLFLMQTNADPYDAFTEVLWWQWLYSIECMPTTLLTGQTKFLWPLISETPVSLQLCLKFNSHRFNIKPFPLLHLSSLAFPFLCFLSTTWKFVSFCPFSRKQM